MRWLTDRARFGVAVLGLALLAGCGSTPSSSAGPSSQSTQLPSRSAQATGTPTAVPSSTDGSSMPAAGRPLDATTLLQAMQTSPRPDGVPDRLETTEIAQAVADAVWTFDGEPWVTMVVGGSCGPDSCLLEVAGTRPGAAGEDLWVFDVDPTAGTIRLVTAELRAIPPSALDALDERARAEASAGLLDGLALTNVRWTPPPSPARYELSYRSGGEEGACAVEIAIDGTTGRVIDEKPTNC